MKEKQHLQIRRLSSKKRKFKNYSKHLLIQINHIKKNLIFWRLSKELKQLLWF